MAEPPRSLPLQQQLCFSLYAANIAVGRLYKPLLDRLAITYPQYLVLSTLWEGDHQTIGAIAENLALESSTVTPLVKRLEAAGLVQRSRNKQDERQVFVGLTEKGSQLQGESCCLNAALLAASELDVPQIMGLNAQVQALTRAVRQRSGGEALAAPEEP